MQSKSRFNNHSISKTTLKGKEKTLDKLIIHHLNILELEVLQKPPELSGLDAFTKILGLN